MKPIKNKEREREGASIVTLLNSHPYIILYNGDCGAYII